jgi:hypothetical protein
MAHSVDPMSDKQITRPPFREALAAWREFLATQKLPAEPLWIFAENLCFEPSSDPLYAAGGGCAGNRL